METPDYEKKYHDLVHMLIEERNRKQKIQERLNRNFRDFAKACHEGKLEEWLSAPKPKSESDLANRQTECETCANGISSNTILVEN